MEILVTTAEQLSSIIDSSIKEALKSYQPQTLADLPDRITIEDVASITGLKKSTIYKLTMDVNLGRGNFPVSKFGHRNVYSRAAIIQWMNENTKVKSSYSQVMAKKLQKQALSIKP